MAIDDADEESPDVEVIRHTVVSGPAAYLIAEQADVDVVLYDNDAPGAIVQETDGGTVVDATDASDTDTYTVRLTRAPEAGTSATITVAPDGQVLASTHGSTFVDGDGLATTVFDDTNWYKPQTVTLKANPDFVPDPDAQPRKVFAPQPHLANRLRGRVEIIGGECDADH